MTEKFDSLGVIFVDDDNKEQMSLALELEKHMAEILDKDLDVVLVDDEEYAREDLGLGDPPTLVHFSNDIPSVYYGQETSEAVLNWLILQKKTETIEVVTQHILSDLIENQEFVAVFFSGNQCLELCTDVLRGLEEIDGDLDSIGETFSLCIRILTCTVT